MIQWIIMKQLCHTWWICTDLKYLIPSSASKNQTQHHMRGASHQYVKMWTKQHILPAYLLCHVFPSFSLLLLQINKIISFEKYQNQNLLTWYFKCKCREPIVNSSAQARKTFPACFQVSGHPYTSSFSEIYICSYTQKLMSGPVNIPTLFSYLMYYYYIIAPVC